MLLLVHWLGVPLPFIGMFAYGLVATIGLQLARKNFPFGIDESYGRLILLGSSTSMAAASAYFLYILSTKFSGASCSYCLSSALLSFSLFFITLKVCFLYQILIFSFLSPGVMLWGHKIIIVICRSSVCKRCKRWWVYNYV